VGRHYSITPLSRHSNIPPIFTAMVIAVNTRLLLKDKLEGIGWFTYETMKRITRQHPEHRFIFLFDRAYDPQFIFSDNITPIAIGPATRHPILWYHWFENVLPKVLREHKADLFLSPDGYLSLSADTRSIAVIHDIHFEHRPEDVPFLARKYYRKYFPQFAKKATRIATVSEYTRNDIAATYGVEKNRIDVVYNGANELYAPCSEETKRSVKGKYTGGADYFLYVGALHPRKNVPRLLEAFDAFKKSTGSPLKLVLVGEKMWKNGELETTYEGLASRQDVIFAGRQPPEELRLLLASAFALTYIPFFEGFGIPIVEAMYSGIPVITSNVTSMPEVAGNAALLIDPHSTDTVTEAMVRITKDEALRRDLIFKGQVRKKDFSWNRSAELLWKCVEKVM
jgi:glycosyltransferase involved in cell wall biosynthesis